MSKSITVTISLPESIVQQIEQTAAAANRSLDDVIADNVLIFYTDDPESSLSLEERIKALETYADNRLKMLVNWRPAPLQQERYHELVEKREFETISDTEQAELTLLDAQPLSGLE